MRKMEPGRFIWSPQIEWLPEQCSEGTIGYSVARDHRVCDDDLFGELRCDDNLTEHGIVVVAPPDPTVLRTGSEDGQWVWGANFTLLEWGPPMGSMWRRLDKEDNGGVEGGLPTLVRHLCPRSCGSCLDPDSDEYDRVGNFVAATQIRGSGFAVVLEVSSPSVAVVLEVSSPSVAVVLEVSSPSVAVVLE
eukprot:gene55658-48912_t